MSSTIQTYDLTKGYSDVHQGANEATLLDDLPLVDRKKDIRQLIRLLNMAKSGQAKSVLICGDEGIGKTALMDSFCELIRKSMYCRILDLRSVRLESAEGFYVSMIEAFQAEASGILDEALEVINEINAELGIQWERQDLLRSIALVKLQESIGGKDALSQERLAKAIKSSIPTVKKLKFSTVNDNIERIVNILVNPWLLVAANLTSPLLPELAEALKLARQLKKESQEPGWSPTQGKKVELAANGNGSSASRPDPDHGLTIDVTPEASPENQKEKSQKGLSAIDFGLDILSKSDPALINDVETLNDLEEKASGEGLMSNTNLERVIPRRFDQPMDGMIYYLNAVFSFVDQAIGSLESGLFLVIDNWEQVASLPESQAIELKTFMANFLKEVVDRKNSHLMVALSCRSASQSEALGGPLYSLFRNKLLLTGINERARQKFFLTSFREAGIQVDESVLHAVFQLTRGNPFWLLKAQHFLMERVESNQITNLTLDFYQKLGLENLNDLLESSFTRIELAYLNEEESLYKVVAALLKYFGLDPFNVQEAVTELSASQKTSELFIAEVLRRLYVHDFLKEVETEGKAEAPAIGPFYQIQSRPVACYLKEKTRAIQSDISTEEKIAYLRKIIPLSVQSGELDREKTQEVIALSTAIGNDTMIPFLQETFLDYLKDENPAVRVTALNNLAMIDSEKSVTAILDAMQDDDVTVREYAARNLSVLSKKNKSTRFHDEITSALIQAIDDESESVRVQVYTTLARYKWNRDLSAVFIKGLADASEAVRETSIQHLVELDVDTPLVRATYLDAMDDSSIRVRRYACLGIQKYQDEETIDILTETLRNDPETSIRALAANVISSMDTDLAFDALAEALKQDSDEDVCLTIVRALAKRKGWQTEVLLLDMIESNKDMETRSPALLWACVRTLGQVAGTERAVELLERLKKQITHDIIELAVDVSLRKIKERLNELRQMEKQLRSATPTTSVVRGDEEDLPLLLEDETL